MSKAGRLLAGIDITLSINDKILGGQSDAHLERTAQIVDTSFKGSLPSSAMTISTSWNVSCDGFIVTKDTAYENLLDAFDLGKLVTVELGHLTYTDFYYKGTALVMEVPEQYSSDGAVKYTLSLRGIGKLERVKTKEE